MTDAPDADMHVVDLTETFPRDESDRLVRWGASFLTCGDEDVVIRSGSLAVEYYGTSVARISAGIARSPRGNAA
jgi:hypothetical protein